jgi:diguanylate cyclase (GGDEF)-like protein
MAVDVKTLYLLNFVLAFVMAAISYFSWFHHRNIVGLRGWALGLALGAIGSLELSLRTRGSPPLLVITANTFVVAGYATVWMTIRRFNRGVVGIAYALVPTGIFLALFTVAVLLGTDVHIRVALASIAIGVLSLLAGREILNDRVREPLTSRMPTASAFLLMAGAMAVRTVSSLLSDSPADETPFYDPTQGYTLFVNTICIVALTLGLLLMGNERLRNHYERLATTDELTGLPNRRHFLEEGERLAAQVIGMKSAACVLMIDLDHFSEVNRKFGHAGGDRALTAFAASAREALRTTDLVARYGGEEFCALLPDADEAEGRRIAERLRSGIATTSIDLDGQPLRITASIGVSPLGDDLRSAMRSADVALYRAKALGRNRVCSASDEASDAAAS